MPEALCVAAICGALWLSHRRFGDTFTPLAAYVTVWCASILLFLLRLVNYIELNERTVFLIGGSIVTYVLGCLCCPRPKASHACTPELSQPLVERALKRMIAVEFAALVIFLLRMQSQFGLSTYLSDPGQIRSQADTWIQLGLLVVPLSLHYPILILSFYHYLSTRRLRWFHVYGMVIPFVQELLWTGRLSLVLFAVTLGLTWVYFHGWRKVNRRLLVTGVAIASILLSAFLAIGSIYGKLVSNDTGIYHMSDFNVESSTMLVLASPYIYASSSLAVFQEAMQDVHYYSYGTRTFYPVARLLYTVGVLKEHPEWTIFDFYFVPVPNNTYTHLFAFYQDFGTPGVLIIPFFLGLLHTYFYWQMRTRRSLWTISATAVSVATICFSIFACLTSLLMVWECYAVIYLVWRYAATVEAQDSPGTLWQAQKGLTSDA